MQGLTVGILSPYLAGSYFGALVSAIAQVVWAAGGHVVAVQTAQPGMELREGLARRASARVGWDRLDGFVVISDATPPGYVAELEQAGKAVVTVAHEEAGSSCPVVMVDNRGGTKRAVEHLLFHGHTRIAFAGCMETFDVRERYESYRLTLVGHGVEADPELFYDVSDNVESGGADAAARMLAAGLPSTAVVAGSDLNALGIIEALKAAGYSLPRDQAITGFDNGVGSALMAPALSTASQDLDRIGGAAAELLLRLLAGEEVPGGRHLVDAPFVVRESCGCALGTRGYGHFAGGDGRGPADALCESVGGAPWPVVGAHVGEGRVGEGGVGEEVAAPVTDLVDVVAQVITSAGEGELDASGLERLRRGCEQLYARRPSQSTADLVVAFTEQLVSQVGEDAPGDPEVVRRLEDCRDAVRLGLTRAALDERTASYYAMRRAVRDEYLITMDLLAGHQEGDPRGLAWLGRTSALAGVLGLWEQGPGTGREVQGAPVRAAGLGDQAGGTLGRGGRALYLASTFRSGAERLELQATHLGEESFPPVELLATLGPGCVVAVVPISSEQADWGLLAMAVPADPAYIGQDLYFMWAAVFAEVLDRQALTSSLVSSEERYALAVRAANDGLWDWDLANGRVYYSERWKEMLGFAPSAIGDSPQEWLGRVHPEDRSLLLAELSSLRRGRRNKVVLEHRLQAKEGSYIWALCRALAVPGHGLPAARLVGSLTDVTERHGLEEQLRRQALYDGLTELPNRVLFMDRLSHALASAKRRNGWSFAVMWLDLDNFKDLNDKKGHLAGDELLVQVAERVRKGLRRADTAARFGGDEFAVLLGDVGETAALETSQRVLEDLKAPYVIEGEEFCVSASVGLVVYAGGYERPEDVLRDADTAMYQAKSAGGGVIVMCGPQMASHLS